MTAPIDMSKANDKDATIKVVLQADSGYMATEQHRISPNQWGDIVGILDGTHTASIPTDARLVTVVQLERWADLSGSGEMLDELRAIIGENGNG